MLMAVIGRMYYGASLEQSGAVVARPKMPPRPRWCASQVGAPVGERSMLRRKRSFPAGDRRAGGVVKKQGK